MKKMLLIAGATVISSMAHPTFAVEDELNIFDECRSPCSLTPEPGKPIQSKLSIPSDVVLDEGVLYYSMTINDEQNDIKDEDKGESIITIGEFATVRATRHYVNQDAPFGVIHLDITTENGTKTYSYNRKEGEFAINWLVPIGEDSPASIKISVDELDQQRNIIEVPKLYSIDLDNQTLEQWKTQGNVSFSVTRPEHNIAISWPSVSYKAAQKEGSRHKRWAHWHTGLALCWLVPMDAIYNYITQQNCTLGDNWFGGSYETVAGTPKVITVKQGIEQKPVEQRIHFSKGNAMSALAAHRVCGVPLETLARSRKPRDLTDDLSCAYQAQNIVSLFVATRILFSHLDSVFTLNLDEQEPEVAERLSALRQINENNPGMVTQVLTVARQIYNDYVTHHPGLTPEQTSAGAQAADILSLFCPDADKSCVASNNDQANINIESRSGRSYLPENRAVITPQGVTNWTYQELEATHQALTREGYVFVGYHGTNHVAAQTIVNRIAPVPRGNNTENEEKWGGLYVATHAEVAHGYARIKEGTGNGGLPTRAERETRGVMLRVYIPRASLERFYRTNTPLENAEEHITQVIGHSLPLRNEAFTGPESAGGEDETVIGWDMAIYAVAIPSTIPGNAYEELAIDEEAVAKEQSISAKPPYKEQKDELK